MQSTTEVSQILLTNGRPVIRGATVTVRQILTYVAKGWSPEQMMAQHSDLTLEGIRAALLYAAQAVEADAVGADLICPAPQTAALPAESVSNVLLVVDDLEPNRRLMELMFMGTEFEIALAESGYDALEKARELRPLLVLSDIQMPGMSGYDLCQQLKSDPATDNIALIFITAHHSSSLAVSKGLDLGADDYVTRPFQREELLARVRAVARVKRAEARTRYQAQVAERRNRELELLSQLALSVSSASEPEQMFGVALPQLAHLLEAGAVALLLVEPHPTRVWCAITTPQGDLVTRTDAWDFNGELTALSIQERAPGILEPLLQLPEMAAHFALKDEHPTFRTVAMASREAIVGALVVIFKQHSTFTTSQWMLLNSAAGIITVAVENHHLWESVQQQIDELTLLNQIGQSLTSTLSLEDLLRTTTDLVHTTLKAQAASVWLLDSSGEELVLAVSSGPGAQEMAGYRLPVNRGIAGQVARTGEAYFSPNVAQDQLHYAEVSQLTQYRPGSLLCVPLLSHNRVLGVVQAMRSEVNGFRPSDLQLFQSVASEVSIAVQNANLFDEVFTFNQQLERMVVERTRELMEEKEKVLAILGGMADGLLILDAEGCLLNANAVAETMLNFSLKDMLGQPLINGQQDSALWHCVGEMTSGALNRLDATVDLTDPQRSDSVVSIQARASQIQDEHGKIIGTAIVLRDVSALKEVERMKARFMAGVTHELKTPLAVIKMHTNNLVTYYKRLPDRKRLELLDAVQRQTRLLEHLVEGILELSRQDSGALKPAFAQFDFTDLVGRVVDELRPLAEGKSLALRFNKPFFGVRMMGDAAQLERVVRNLIDNAIKYTATGQVQVNLATETVDKRLRVHFRVSDTGMGIPSGAQSRVFERFYRVDPSHTIPGTGLGLAIVKEIVEAHGGTVTLQSVEGQGTTFQVTLPGKQANQERGDA